MTGGPTGRRLSHLDEHGAARMVDVSDKASTARSATASAAVHTTAEVVSQICSGGSGGLSKGDALAVARIAGIQAAKRTSELIPLCHQVPLSAVDIEFVVTGTVVEITATARTTDRTGVEMEALTAVTVGALTVYDMIKAVDPAARIEGIRVLSKRGGKTGGWDAPQ